MPPPTARKLLAYIGANVRKGRERLDLTQEALAEKAGFDIRNFRFIERGRANISIDTLVRLASVLEVKPEALLAPTQILPARPGRPKKRIGPGRGTK